jgi:Outer membrane protein beta-barrel domain
MKRTLIVLAIGVASWLGLAANAHAQLTWTDKAFVSVNFGAQAPSQSLTTLTTPVIYGEPASFTSSQEVGGGAFFDISAGYKVWRNLAVGLGVTHVGSTTDLTVNAAIPDPLFFDQHRLVTISVPDAKHSQTAINLTGTWVMPITDKIDLAYQFGPTIFLVSQDIPGTPAPESIVEPGPSITALPVDSVDKSTVGLHFGLDLTYMVTPRFGAGGIIRYTWGSADLAGAEDSIKLGGFQIGGGLRVRF